ncbi:hypothetical protein Y013_26455 (plasmid) [Rhodococcus pyridinivorans SB3094]|uniref:Uncharacterized protein n=1 Tax=Rhodococcus pyridinivorans SB3094 TaxID=1435356 RepID=V9XLP5_9NOCA|nr:hypothetical protein Y013_26455 [Rhodococcus pyridinivorans SB3094]
MRLQQCSIPFIEAYTRLNRQLVRWHLDAQCAADQPDHFAGRVTRRRCDPEVVLEFLGEIERDHSMAECA